MADQSVLALSRRLLLVVTLALLHGPSVTSAQGNATYAVVAPKNMRPGTTYGVSVTLFQAPSPVTFKVWIQDTSRGTKIASGTAVLGVTSSNTFSFQGPTGVKLPPVSPLRAASTALVSLKIPIVVFPSSYSLFVEASGGLKFSQSSPVGTGAKTLSIFVQTDKAIYKPGQTVLFRAIALYPTLLPYKGEVNITVSDPKGNKIAQWLKLKSATGVNGDSLKLTAETALGDWTIQVTALNNVFSKIFSVEEYVLPKYKVETSLPPYFFININQPSLQEDFTATVTAKYTYGEPVKGQATVTIQLSYTWYDDQSTPRPSRDFTIELEQGSAQVTLSVDDLLALIPTAYQWSQFNPNDPREKLFYRTVEVSSGVLETVTGITLKDSASTQCVRNRYILEFLSITPQYYKRGLTFYGYLKLGQHGDLPPKAADVRDAVTGQYRSLTVTAGSQPPFEVPLTDSGYVMFDVLISSDDSSPYIQAQYEDRLAQTTVSVDGRSLSPFNSRDNDSIQVVLAGANTAIEPNTNVKFNVKTSKSVNVFSYQILSKGTIVQTKSVVELKASTDHSFTLSVTAALAQTLSPSMIVVVWFVNDNGELVADSLKIPVNGVFAHEVSLSFNKDKVAPGDSINLTVNARAGSHVGLLVVDMSVLLLRTGNDITRDMVSSDVSKYDSDDSNGVDGGGFQFEPMWRWWWPCFVVGEDSTSLLRNVGVITFTDATIYETPPFRWWWGGGDYPMYAMEGPVPAPPVLEESAPADGNGGPNKEPARVRKNFPETWIWSYKTAGNTGSVVITAPVPDTITRWVASGYAVSEQVGLGIAATTAKLTVFQPFFISLTLPYAIIRGEVFQLKVSIFNYMPTDQQVTVTLQQSNEYKVRVDGNAEPQSIDATVTINVASNDATTADYWVYATTLGQILLKVKAQSPLAADAVNQQLLVKPEGVTKRYSNGVLIQLPGDGSTYSTTMTVDLPPTGVLVPDSEYIDCTLIGDILGPALANLDHLLQMPGGCGEQNMLGLAPDVYILHYLTTSGFATVELTNKVTNYIRQGYQQELTYQRWDGSFSAFGDSDQSGSTWLSAFVVRVFYQARAYIPVEDYKLAQTLDWILQQQNSDGSFREPGIVYHTDMQGGASKGVPLAAYVLITLHLCKENTAISATALSDSITKATTFLQDQLDSLTDDTYTLCIVTRALTLVGSSRAPAAYEELLVRAITEDGSIHWEKSPNDHTPPDPNIWIPPYMQANAFDVEMTSYALLTLLAKNDIVKSLLVARWLIKQQNSYGGFASTQDTVVALEALSGLATVTSGGKEGSSLNVVCRVGSVQSQFKAITKENSLLVQTFQLPSTTTEVQISASGKGNALVQLNVKYNVYDVTNGNGIDLTIDARKHGINGNTYVYLCGSWVKKTVSGMVVLEFNLLTGYAATNTDTLRNQTGGIIKRIEKDGQKIVLYFDEFTSTPLCFEIILGKNLIVENVQKAAVLVYAYYDTKSTSTLFYEPPDCVACPDCCESGDGSKVPATPVPPTPLPATSEWPIPN